MEVEQVVPGGQDAHNIVDILTVHREPGQPRLADGVQDLPLLRVHGEGHHVGAVEHHVLGGGVVELKDVLDKFLFIALDGARLLALLHHGPDIVLRHLILPVEQRQNGPPQQLDNIDA